MGGQSQDERLVQVREAAMWMRVWGLEVTAQRRLPSAFCLGGFSMAPRFRGSGQGSVLMGEITCLLPLQAVVYSG